MSIYTPFTYIIGWSQHKKFYYGAKYAQGCQPSDLWESYFTSSKYVEEFRKENGDPDIVRIHKIFADKNSCIRFESYYLTKINAKSNSLFLNKHNGWGDFDYDDQEIKEKTKQTSLKKYGVICSLQSPNVIKKSRQTSLKKYGTISPNQAEIVKDKKKTTNLLKYGFEHTFQIPIFKEKSKQTTLEKWGVENVFQNEKIKKLSKQTNLEKYGVEYALQNKEIRNKGKKTCVEKYGVEYAQQMKFFTILETGKSYPKNALSRYYPEFKQYY